MNDQAKSLRKQLEQRQEKPAKVISVISGKGGVGKSNFSLNFALALQQLGKKVVLFDLDIGMANVDVLMGVSTKYSLIDMVERDLLIWDIIAEGPEGLAFITGGSGLTNFFELDEQKMSRFIRQLESLQQNYDYIIFDMGAGLSNDSLKFILSSDEVILLTTPEPTSITDAYAALKFVHVNNGSLPVHLLINRCDNEKEGKDIGERLKIAAEHFLHKDIDLFGFLPDDLAVAKAVKIQVPFLINQSNAKVSQSLKIIAQKYTGLSGDSAGTNGGFLKKFKKYFHFSKENMV